MIPTPARPAAWFAAVASYGRGAMLTVNGGGPRRWPAGLRAALCMGAPVLVGWMAGDVGAGLTATLGGFTALYGAGRPYWNRAALLAGITASFGVAVALGTWAATIPLLGVCAMAVIASLATWVCNALAVGPPGAYQFALVCATGIGLRAHHSGPAETGLLVLGGGVFAWLVHMSGALVRPRGPELAAVRSAGLAVAGYLEARGTDAEGSARHRAAQDLHLAWTTLLDRQPRRRRPGHVVAVLQQDVRELQTLFADAMTDPARPSGGATARARAMAHYPLERSDTAGVAGRDERPFVRVRTAQLLRRALQPHTRSHLVVVRVGLATLLAGLLGSLLGLHHAYWAMSAAVLVLYQGLDRRRTVRRGLERIVGTCLGLGLAAVVIPAQLHAAWLIAVIMVLNFVIEVIITKSYPLAVVFMTATALLIATGGTRPPDLGAVLLARGLDTAVGCTVAVIVFLVLVARESERLARPGFPEG